MSELSFLAGNNNKRELSLPKKNYIYGRYISSKEDYTRSAIFDKIKSASLTQKMYILHERKSTLKMFDTLVSYYRAKY